MFRKELMDSVSRVEELKALADQQAAQLAEAACERDALTERLASSVDEAAQVWGQMCGRFRRCSRRVQEV
jgi:hypothetical protein